jgi:hypothetical protein
MPNIDERMVKKDIRKSVCLTTLNTRKETGVKLCNELWYECMPKLLVTIMNVRLLYYGIKECKPAEPAQTINYSS